MTPTWSGPPEPEAPPPGPAAWLRIVLRGVPLMALLLIAFPLKLLLRLPERALCGARRPVTPFITQAVCRIACPLLGLRLRITGAPAPQGGVAVANHASWLDIFALNAAARGSFVAKAEVRDWIGIGWLARGTGTLFIERARTQARRHTDAMAERLRAGGRVFLFAEGTSTDGQQVLPFRSTLFQAFLAEGLRDGLHVQPVSVVYHAPPGQDRRFYGWWGGMGFAPSLLKTLATGRPGAVDVVFHPALRVAAFSDRKALTRAVETAVRTGFAARISPAGALSDG